MSALSSTSASLLRSMVSGGLVEVGLARPGLAALVARPGEGERAPPSLATPRTATLARASSSP